MGFHTGPTVPGPKIHLSSRATVRKTTRAMMHFCTV